MDGQVVAPGDSGARNGARCDAEGLNPVGYHIPEYVRTQKPSPGCLAWTPLLDALLMDAISNGSTFSAAGRICGMNKDQAASRFNRLRHSMGRQAA